MSEVTITVSGRTFTGKTTIANTIVRYLRKKGFKVTDESVYDTKVDLVSINKNYLERYPDSNKYTEIIVREETINN